MFLNLFDLHLNMAKIKLHGRTVYPFKHLEKVGDKFTTNKPKNNVMTAYRNYKASNNIACSFAQYEDGQIVVTRIA